MHAHALLAREARRLTQQVQRPDGTAAAIVGVLQGQEALRQDHVGDAVAAGPAQGGAQMVGLDQAVGAALDEAQRDAPQGRRRTPLVVGDVASGLGQDLVAGLGVEAQGELVAHGPAGDEECRLLAQDLGRAALERPDGGILAIDVVADLGRGHGGAHGGRRPGERVAPEVDHAGSHLPAARWGRRKLLSRGAVKPQRRAGRLFR